MMTASPTKPLRNLSVVIILVAIGGVFPVALAWHFGALGIPRGDDWAYLLSAFRLADTGKVSGEGWASMNLVGQLALSSPFVWVFGHRIEALQLEVAAVGVVGLFAVFDLAKRLVSPRRALFVALVVAVGPFWASLSVSFMTDVPAFALGMACLALGGRALRRDGVDLPLLCGSLFLGFWAFTVREYAIVPPLAVAIVAISASRRSARGARSALLIFAGFVALVAVFVAWHRGLGGFTPLTPERPSASSLEQALDAAAQSAILLGFVIFPVVLLAGPLRIARAAWGRAAWATVAIASATTAALVIEMIRQRHSGQFLGPGNYVLPQGTFGTDTLPGTRPDLLPRAILAAAAVVGILSIVVALLAALVKTVEWIDRSWVRRAGSSRWGAGTMVALAALGYALLSALPATVKFPVFDRYLLPLIPLVAILVLYAVGGESRSSRSSRAMSVGALVAVGLFGAIYAANAASFDGTKWEVSERATGAVAGKPQRVNGGFEWVGYYHDVPTVTKRFGNLRGTFCVSVRADRTTNHGGHVVSREGVWGPTGRQVWIVARTRGPC